ncbi:hypothetical protein HDU98_006498 [Podochytrium sp. JEL0797]|nr:hypothetical protein HDU98_006498 [Podochytrium sp. JEL0797]
MSKARSRLIILALVAGTTFLLWALLSNTTSTTSPIQDHRHPSDPYSMEAPLKTFAFATIQQEAVTYYPLNRTAGFSISEILELCHTGDSLQITRYNAMKGSVQQLTASYVSECAPIEINTSQGGRSMGHCSDFAQYIYHADARLTIQFGADTFEKKAKTCPRSTYLHGEYAIETLLLQPGLRNYWMPNLEQILIEQMWYFRNVSRILCKTRVTCEACNKLIEAEGLKGVEAVYMSHSSPDPQLGIVEQFGETKAAKMERARDFNKFYHAYGYSGRKSTWDVIDCWNNHADWPTLTIVGHYSKQTVLDRYKRLPWNLKIHESVSIETLRQLQSKNAIHITSSMQEGYGHYINEARALGLLVMTTDWAPMNEFVVDGVSGILIGHEPPVPESHQGMQPYFISPVKVNETGVMKTSIKDRKEMGRKARLGYEEDTRVMISNMDKLRKEANEYLVYGGQ